MRGYDTHCIPLHYPPLPWPLGTFIRALVPADLRKGPFVLGTPNDNLMAYLIGSRALTIWTGGTSLAQAQTISAPCTSLARGLNPFSSSKAQSLAQSPTQPQPCPLPPTHPHPPPPQLSTPRAAPVTSSSTSSSTSRPLPHLQLRVCGGSDEFVAL